MSVNCIRCVKNKRTGPDLRCDECRALPRSHEMTMTIDDQVTEALNTLPKFNPINPQPGVYPDVPAVLYHAAKGASAHRLSLLARSPAHMKYAMDNPEEPTPAMVLGEAVHVATLEPTTFVGRYAVAPECDRRTKDGKATWQAFTEKCDAMGAKAIKADDAETCLRIRDAVRLHPAARALLDACTATELSAVWKCRQTGVGCKLRTDMLCDSLGVVVDLKTCEDASRAAFERSIFNFGYQRQAAHYLRGMAANGIAVDGFVFIAVEKSPPHACAVYRLDDEVVAAGDEEVLRLLELYGKCERTGVYPAYSAEVQNVRVSNWAMRQMNG